MANSRKKNGSWQSRRSKESRQVDEGYHAWLKRRKSAGKPVPKQRKASTPGHRALHEFDFRIPSSMTDEDDFEV